MKLENGKPQNLEERLEKERKTYAFLENLGIGFERVDHEPAMTMEVCREIDKVLGAATCKNLFLCNRQETDFYLLLTPGEKRFKTKFLSKELGVARLSFANETYMEKFLDITSGSVSVMGLMNDIENHVQLVIDEDVIAEEYVCCHPCINTSTIKLKVEDLMKKIIPAMNHKPIIVHLEEEDA